MKLVSGIVDSGFFAQSALSAEVATKDSLGRNISETYLTGVDLTPYQTTAGMTAYQSAGEYYSASNPSGFITGVPGTYLQNTDLTIADNKVTEISGIPLAGGGEFPQSATEAVEVVTANSADWNSTTDTVTANSAVWGGSALPISAGPGIKFEMVDNTLVASVDETVLWEGEMLLTAGQTSSFSVNENISSFNSIRVYSKPSYGVNNAQCIMIHEEAPLLQSTNWQFFTEMDYPKIHGSASIQFDMNNLTIINNTATYYGYGRGRVSGYQMGFERNDRGATLLKIVGINRIAGGN